MERNSRRLNIAGKSPDISEIASGTTHRIIRISLKSSATHALLDILLPIGEAGEPDGPDVILKP